MWKKNKRGQSTVEYILLVTAVVSVGIIFLTNKNTGLQKKMNTTLEDVSDSIVDKGATLRDSHAAAAPGGASPNPGVSLNVFNHTWQ
jgi:hypothetical protein